MSDENEEGNEDIDLLAIAREEAQRTVDNQIETLNDIDSKAARILRINLVLLSIILTGLSVATNSQTANAAGLYLPNLINNYTISGLLLLLFSTGVAGITYTASNLKAGMSGRDLKNLLDNEYSDQRNVEGIVESYAGWIQRNYRVNAKNAPLGTLTILLLLYAMAALALGVKEGVSDSVEWWLFIGTLTLLIGVTYYTGFHEQVKRYWELRDS